MFIAQEANRKSRQRYPIFPSCWHQFAPSNQRPQPGVILPYVGSFRRMASQKFFGVGQSTVSPRSRDRSASSSISSRARRETNQLDDAPVTSGDEGDLPPPRERSLSTLCRWTPTAGTPRPHSDSKWYCPATSAAGRGGICVSLPAPHRLRLRGHREDGVLRHELAESSEVPPYLLF